jgi:acyl-CoA reductase-like NAD-dependent aldehyde dehydrogenase
MWNDRFNSFLNILPCMTIPQIFHKMHQRPQTAIPLILNGEDYQLSSVEHIFQLETFGKEFTQPYKVSAQGADLKTCHLAVDSCARAFGSWRDSTPHRRRTLFLNLANLLREKGHEIQSIMEEEINCTPLWSHINLEDSIKLIQEAAALVTSPTLSGVIPQTQEPDSQALILTEPLGVILGIAPWNAPLFLGFRAVVGPIAAGNTAILKGSELSPRTHYFIARLFHEAGFPPGILNFILHREQDAPQVFRTLIERNEVRKCNFTGSTPVGRLIASQAAKALKPVLLELGGKNFAVVLEDADLDKAARLVVEGAFLNVSSLSVHPSRF